MAAVSGGALLVSLLLTVLATNWVLRPLNRIEQTIDRIVQGNYRGDESERGDGQGIRRGGKQAEPAGPAVPRRARGSDRTAAQPGQMLERMASQLDVASRLAAISRITGGVAHEIKNPLNAISLRLDLLRARLGAPEEELIAEIDILSKEVRRLDRVVKTFLDFSRPVEVRFEEVDLAALAREVAELMTPQARLANIAVDFDAPDNVGPKADPAALQPTWIRGDADMLKQAILNLVTNALDAMKQRRQLADEREPAGDSLSWRSPTTDPASRPSCATRFFSCTSPPNPRAPASAWR